MNIRDLIDTYDTVNSLVDKSHTETTTKTDAAIQALLNAVCLILIHLTNEKLEL